MNPKGIPDAKSRGTRTAALRQSAGTSRTATPVAALLPKEEHASVTRTTWSAPKPEDPALIRLLLKEANRRGHQPVEMAESLGCTYGYISQLRCGHRRPEHIGQEFADRVGAYLGVPTALVKLVAGRVTADDFRWPQRDESQDIAECLQALREDPAIGGYVPPQLDHADPQVQRFVWQLYTECADRHTAALQAMPKMLGYLQRAAEGQARYEQALAALRDAVAAPSACTKDAD